MIGTLPRAINPALQELNVKVSQETYERIVHHAVRLGTGRAELLRNALGIHLLLLDEQEAFIRAQKAARTKPRGCGGYARVGAVPQGRNGEPPGMKIRLASKETAAQEKTAKEAAAKLERSFSMWAVHVERSDGAVDRSIRLQTVLDDMRERVPHDQADVGFIKFQEFIKLRAETAAPKIVKLPDGVPVHGDVDELTG